MLSVVWPTFQQVIAKPELFDAEVWTFMCLVLKSNMVSAVLKSSCSQFFSSFIEQRLKVCGTSQFGGYF